MQRRLNGRFAKEPRRGIDPHEQRQIEAFIARNGVKRAPPADGSLSAVFNHMRGEFTSGGFGVFRGRGVPKAHAP